MPAPTVLVTGFPGFLGSALLPHVLARLADHDAVCLVQARFAGEARRRLTELEAAHPHVRGRVRLVEGDITRPGLGLADERSLHATAREIHHLAAVYDLSVPPDVATRVNVDGTRHVLDVAERCTGLVRLHYVSTCYVSGRHPGVFRERDLDVGQTFNNAYEATKHRAEVEVRARMDAGLPATVYRPAIVVGDSATGATQKFDGPYHAIRWLLRQHRRVAVMPVVGDATATQLNVVPRDFVIGAMAHLAGLDVSLGRTYHLADPAPLTVDAFLRVVAAATGQHVVRVPLPAALAKALIDRVPGVSRVMRIPSSTIDYFTHPTRYDTANASSDLAGSGIRCPRFTQYADALVRFARAHPEIGSAAMV